jgi:hypothetical protein
MTAYSEDQDLSSEFVRAIFPCVAGTGSRAITDDRCTAGRGAHRIWWSMTCASADSLACCLAWTATEDR